MNCRYISLSRVHGFTLVELMITLAVMAILLALATPSFEGLIASSRLASATNELNATLRQARSEAMRRGQRVTVCASANGNQCTNNDWTSGWIMFVDRTRGAAAVDAGETILQVFPALTGGVVAQGQANVARFVSFSSDGQSRTMGADNQAGTIQICSTSNGIANDNRARNLIVAMSGQVVMQPINGINNNCPAP